MLIHLGFHVETIPMGKGSKTGFTLVELVVTIAILGILISTAVPSYIGFVEKATKQVCNTNCRKLERTYQVYLIVENKLDTNDEFIEFLQRYDENICPVNGDIVYKNAKVRCLLHSNGENGGNMNEEDGGSVPFL